MSIVVPILTEFKSNGIQKAVDEFKSLEGAGKKAQFAIKKAAVPAAAALAGLGAALFDATKGAIEDAASADKLANQLRRVTIDTEDAIKANETWITKQGQLRAFTDSQLRPVIAKLATTTGDLAQAQSMATLAMDISVATGKDLDTVTTALSKAYAGNEKALAKIDPTLKDFIASGADMDQIMGRLNATFGGAAVQAANTAEGGFKRMGIALDETKESIGAALLPIVEKALPILQKFAEWAQNNPTVFTTIAAAIGAVSVAILAVNTAMALNPFSAIAAGVAVLVVALVTAYKKFEWFRDGVNTVINGVLGYFETLVNGWIHVVNGIIRAWNLVPGHKDINTIGTISLGRIGQADAGSGGANVPRMADGGIVTAPTLALIGEAGPEAVVPLGRMGNMAGGNNITINVNGGDPLAVVDALRRYNSRYGALPVRVA